MPVDSKHLLHGAHAPHAHDSDWWPAPFTPIRVTIGRPTAVPVPRSDEIALIVQYFPAGKLS